MWGYQLHFRIGQECQAERLFQGLDTKFDPEVFLVGILMEERSDRYPACVEPEDDFWIPSEAFDSVLSGVPETVSSYPESELRHSHPLAQQWHDEGLVKRAVQDLVGQIANSHPDRPESMRYFSSWPVPLDGFLVSLVLGLQEAVIQSHASLASQVPIHEYRSFRVPRSLIDAVAEEYLRDAASELLKPDSGSDPMSGKSPDELLRAAGKRMIAGAAQRADTFDNQEGHEAMLFDACNRISALKYEGADSAGHILLARAHHPSIVQKIVFGEPISVSNSRSTRKLLELAQGDMALHMNAKDSFALAHSVDYDLSKEDVYEINILGHHRWTLSHSGIPLMYVKDGLPALPAPVADPALIRMELHREFRHCVDYQLDLLIDLVCEAAGEKHGTMLVISENAADEANRLRQQGTPIQPCRLSPEWLRQLTPIDGAVLLDPGGICYSIGVILDGLATEGGNSARGARYNSAVRYVASQQCACMAVVVSEDGGIDLVPERLPPIRRSAIEERLAQLQSMLAGKHVNRRAYRKTMDWFDGKRFYLLPEHCGLLNQLMAEIDERVALQDPEAPHIVRHNFVPDLSFEPGLYYEEELQE